MALVRHGERIYDLADLSFDTERPNPITGYYSGEALLEAIDTALAESRVVVIARWPE